MIRLSRFVLSTFALVSGAALGGETTGKDASINDKDVPAPITCYINVGRLTGDKEMPVGLAVRLCAGTKDAMATLACYSIAFETLGLNRGLAIELCSEGRKAQ